MRRLLKLSEVMRMKKLSIEVYAFMDKSPKKYGTYKAVMDDDCILLAIVYSIDDGNSVVLDIESGQTLSEELIYSLMRTDIEKNTYNSEFTRLILSKYLNLQLPIAGWKSIVDMQTYLGFSAISDIYKTFAVEKADNDTIAYFCRTTKPDYERNSVADNPDKWKSFLIEIRKDFWNRHLMCEALRKYPMEEYYMDYINLRYKIKQDGVKVKEAPLRKAMSKEHWSTVEYLFHMCLEFGLDNKKKLLKAIKSDISLETLPENITCNTKHLLSYRTELGYGNLTKFKKLYHRICPDGYIHGWEKEKFDIPTVYKKYIDAKSNIGSISFSYLSIGIMAWLSNEQWIINALNSNTNIHDKLICKNNLSKENDVDALYNACMWCGGIWQLEKSGFIKDGSIADYNNYVVNWRLTNSNIASFWGQIYRAFCYTVMNKKDVKVNKLTFHYEYDNVTIQLPSGRKLLYLSPRVEVNNYGEPDIIYSIFNTHKEYKQVKAKAGIICRRIVNSIVDDIIAYYALLLSKQGITVLSISPKRIMVEYNDSEDLNIINLYLSENSPTWSKGLPLLMECQAYVEVKEENEYSKIMDKHIS